MNNWKYFCDYCFYFKWWICILFIVNSEYAFYLFFHLFCFSKSSWGFYALRWGVLAPALEAVLHAGVSPDVGSRVFNVPTNWKPLQRLFPCQQKWWGDDLQSETSFKSETLQTSTPWQTQEKTHLQHHDHTRHLLKGPDVFSSPAAGRAGSAAV